jgi:hypothetical protein
MVERARGPNSGEFGYYDAVRGEGPNSGYYDAVRRLA